MLQQDEPLTYSDYDALTVKYVINKETNNCEQNVSLLDHRLGEG